jgi:DNA-binding NarL/FixJ family response regulator
MSEPVRVLITEDHPLFRDGLAGLLRAAPGIELAGAAATGTEAVELARQARPDVVLMDLRLPGLNGIEATRQIVADSPHTAVVVLTMFDDDDSVFAAVRAGARGYLLKGADQDEIIRAVHAAAAGEAIFGAGLASRVLAYFTAQPSTAPSPFPQLTDREREVLELVARAVANPVIATRLQLSQKTIRSNVSNISSSRSPTAPQPSSPPATPTSATRPAANCRKFPSVAGLPSRASGTTPRAFSQQRRIGEGLQAVAEHSRRLTLRTLGQKGEWRLCHK